jgi:hypothetical protein
MLSTKMLLVERVYRLHEHGKKFKAANNVAQHCMTYMQVLNPMRRRIANLFAFLKPEKPRLQNPPRGSVPRRPRQRVGTL